MSKGIGGHQRAFRGRTEHWLTPPRILGALGPFDLDPCCPPSMPWRTARTMIVPPQDGLQDPWTGRVFCNPPYGPETGKWLRRLAEHGNGIALIFARTETEMFHRWVWQQAQALLFLRGRLHFHELPDGARSRFNAGGPSCLVAYSESNAAALQDCGIPGAFVRLGQARDAGDFPLFT